MHCLHVLYRRLTSTPCSHLARLPVLNPGNGWKTSWCACLPIMATSERYSRATGGKSQRLAASSMQLSESGSNLPELRKSCCHLHITPCHLYVLRWRLTLYMYFFGGWQTIQCEANQYQDLCYHPWSSALSEGIDKSY